MGIFENDRQERYKEKYKQKKEKVRAYKADKILILVKQYI